MPPLAIEIKDLHKSFGGQKVLAGLNLSIPRQQTTVIIGGSGNGKSVLLKHMIGLLRPERGQVLVEGRDITKMSDAQLNRLRRNFGMLFQDAALFDSMTVADNVAFPLREHTRLGADIVARQVADRLAAVGLSGAGSKMPAELSGGMRKRAGLARALALDPKILLVDEPTTGLDPLMTRAINHFLQETQARLGLTAVIISHDLAGAYTLAHKIVMLKEGKIVAEGSPEDIKNHPSPLVREFVEAAP
jgi:phospholipid/cholesterol/gamma-HCH transport system ATP-binding protein